MNRPLSPLERMIDEACGFNPVDYWSKYIRLACPYCKKETTSIRHWIDPEKAVRMTYPCNECFLDHAGDEVLYFDEKGNRLELRDVSYL